MLSKLHSDIGNEFSLLGSLQFCQLGNMQRKHVSVITWETVPHLPTIIVNASLQGDVTNPNGGPVNHAPRDVWA